MPIKSVGKKAILPTVALATLMEMERTAVDNAYTGSVETVALETNLPAEFAAGALEALCKVKSCRSAAPVLAASVAIVAKYGDSYSAAVVKGLLACFVTVSDETSKRLFDPASLGFTLPAPFASIRATVNAKGETVRPKADLVRKAWVESVAHLTDAEAVAEALRLIGAFHGSPASPGGLIDTIKLAAEAQFAADNAPIETETAGA